MNIIIFLSIIILFCACNNESVLNEKKITKEIISVLKEQEQAWNEGNIEKFMESYVRSDSLHFASGGSVSYGWQTTLERYKRGYPDRSVMGKLIYSNLEVTVISKDAALVFGKWELNRENDKPWGLFTLLFRKIGDGWRIVADHTSSAAY
ncbi:MAG: hypothetical protein A2V66_10300 [Ignavibacteria bacterium RBG_13_36_8]|nr:MAG: hypothetical protein A2V66_10300 [Ignavibacteria bacterium RBG_13_36_8]